MTVCLLIIFIGKFAYEEWTDKRFDVEYAYIKPNSTKVQIVDEFQPPVEWRKSGNVILPFIAGTSNLLVGFDRMGPYGKKQWIVSCANGINTRPDDIPKNSQVEKGSLDDIPEPYRHAVFEHNRAGPQGKDDTGLIKPYYLTFSK